MDSYILYVDMLGFSELLMNHDEGLEEIRPVYRSSDPDEYDELEDFYESHAAPSEPASSELATMFTMFHRCLNAARDHVTRSRAGSVLIFSDSAFFQTNDLEQVLDLSRGLMHSLIINEVPVRMGIGHGSFKMLRFTSDYSTQVTMHTSQFLGVGVVRAHGAEQCGAKGMRILVHPCVHKNWTMEMLHDELVPVTPAPSKPVKTPVVYELNYLHSAEMGQDDDIDLTLFNPVLSMWRSAPEEFKFQYEQTFNAMNGMRREYMRNPVEIGDLLRD